MNMSKETRLGDRQGYERLFVAIFKSAYIHDRGWIKAEFSKITNDTKWIEKNEHWLKTQIYSALTTEMDHYPVTIAEARKARQNILNELIHKYNEEKHNTRKRKGGKK